MAYIHSFPPISAPTAQRLVLGSMPGKASLAANEYYAHPHNRFWRIMGEILDFPFDLPYQSRCDALTGRRIALWDVLKTCTRSSSLDSDIVESSMITNDFAGFLRAHPDITAIFFNGAKAEMIYMRHVRPRLPAPLAGIRTVRLPSTSPANASIPFQIKMAQWRAVAEKI